MHLVVITRRPSDHQEIVSILDSRDGDDLSGMSPCKTLEEVLTILDSGLGVAVTPSMLGSIGRAMEKGKFGSYLWLSV